MNAFIADIFSLYQTLKVSKKGIVLNKRFDHTGTERHLTLVTMSILKIWCIQNEMKSYFGRSLLVYVAAKSAVT